MLQYIDSIKKVDSQSFTVECMFHNEAIVRRIPVGKLIREYQDTPLIKELLQR